MKKLYDIDSQVSTLKKYYPDLEHIKYDDYNSSYIKLPIKLKPVYVKEWSHSEFNAYFDV